MAGMTADETPASSLSDVHARAAGLSRKIDALNPLSIAPGLRPVRIVGLAAEPPNVVASPFYRAGLSQPPWWLDKGWAWVSPTATLVDGETPLFGTPLLLAHPTLGWQLDIAGVFGYHRYAAFDDENNLRALMDSLLACDVAMELVLASLAIPSREMRQHRNVWEKLILKRAAARALPENGLLVSQVKQAAEGVWRAQCDNTPGGLIDVELHSWWLNLGDHIQWKGLWEPPSADADVAVLAFNLDFTPSTIASPPTGMMSTGRSSRVSR